MKRVVEHGVNHQWGVFSQAIKGRVGYQCSNYWRQMMKDGWVKDPNYWIRADGSFQFKRAKKGSIPDEIRRYSFVVLTDPSGVFAPLPGSHPKRPSDSKLAKYLQSDVRQLSEKEKKGGKRGKKAAKKKKKESADTEKAEEEEKEETADSKEDGVEDGEETADNAEATDKDKKGKSKKAKKSKKKSSKKKGKKKKKDTESDGADADEDGGDEDGDGSGEDVKEKKKSKKKGKSKGKKSKKSKKKEDAAEDEEADSKKKVRGKKRKHSGRKDELEPPQKKRKTATKSKKKGKKGAVEKEAEEVGPMAVLKGMTDMMTGEPMENPAISPYGHVMEYESWTSILRNAKTKNKCPFTQQTLTRRQLVKLDESNIEEYKDQIVNVGAGQTQSEE